MHRLLALFVTVFAMIAGQAAAQTPAAGEADPGVRPTRMIDREEVRVSRVEIEAGATRRVHAHTDVEYHLWIPVQGTLQLTIGSDPPIAAQSGQAFFLKRGTSHGFKNVGTTAAAVLEIFVKQTAVAPAADGLAALAAIELARGGNAAGATVTVRERESPAPSGLTRLR